MTRLGRQGFRGATQFSRVGALSFILVVLGSYSVYYNGSRENWVPMIVDVGSAAFYLNRWIRRAVEERKAAGRLDSAA